MRFDIANRPFFKWTLTAATIITDSISAGPTGPNKPSAVSRPPANSAVAAVAANMRPGRKPSISRNPAVPARPWPPNQPKSFWAPCAVITRPKTSRMIIKPSSMTHSLRTKGPAGSRTSRRAREDYTKHSHYMSRTYLPIDMNGRYSLGQNDGRGWTQPGALRAVPPRERADWTSVDRRRHFRAAEVALPVRGARRRHPGHHRSDAQRPAARAR